MLFQQVQFGFRYVRHFRKVGYDTRGSLLSGRSVRRNVIPVPWSSQSLRTSFPASMVPARSVPFQCCGVLFEKL